MSKNVLSKKELLKLHEKMVLIREFEEACGENYAKGFIRGFLHLYIGEEAIAVGAISQLEKEDFIVFGDSILTIYPDFDFNIFVTLRSSILFSISFRSWLLEFLALSSK